MSTTQRAGELAGPFACAGAPLPGGGRRWVEPEQTRRLARPLLERRHLPNIESEPRAQRCAPETAAGRDSKLDDPPREAARARGRTLGVMQWRTATTTDSGARSRS